MSSSLDYLELCRLCLVKDRVSVPIFEDEGDVRQIFLKITACLPVKVSREDKLPKKICDDCVYKVELFYQFWNTTANAEKQLLQWLGEVGGLEDKQGYVTEVLDTNVMKQERSSDSRLDGSVMQVGGHQNSMDMGMMDIITMPAGSEQQFTSVPMDTSGTVQTVQVVPGPSTQTTHDQMAQSQATHLGEESEEDNSDDGCDNEEGLPVKEEHEDDQGDQSLETTTFVALPCDEAGPSGLQQQKISEMSEMSMQQTADNDPKTGLHLIGPRVPRIFLPRLTDMEIDMIKIQLREYGWIKEENNNNNNNEESKKVQKRKKRRKTYYSKQPYCRGCKRYYKNYTVLAAHRRLCGKPAENPTTDCKLKKQEIPEAEPPDHEEVVVQNDGKVEKFELRPLVSCKDCKLNFATTRELFEHRQYLNCKVCSLRDEESDLSDVTDEEYEYDSLYACAVCRAKFISRELLDIHRAREAHWGPAKTKADFVVVKRELEDFTFRSCEENEYSCTGCSSGRVFYDPDDLLRHHRAAHSSTEIYCRYCCLRLADIGEFNDHHRAYHDLLDYCRVCNDKEEKHIKTGKVPPKPWCLNCCRKLGLPFQDCLSLLKETLYCEDCGRAMPSAGHMQYHNCSHPEHPHELPLSILVCPLCRENFNSLRSLYRHIIKHNDMMSYRCNPCGKLHETWKELKAHANRCHANENMRLPRMNCDVLKRNAEDVIRRFVKNGVKLLTN